MQVEIPQQRKIQGAGDDREMELVCVSEDEWDDSNVDPAGVALDYHTRREVRRRESYVVSPSHPSLLDIS